jgi:chorismate mutase/prephenate dehydratase
MAAMSSSRPGSRGPACGPDTSLAQLRTNIDAVDDRILALLDERAHLARRVGLLKSVENLPVRDVDRERKVMDRLAARVTSFPSESIRTVYREVIRACRAVQEMDPS